MTLPLDLDGLPPEPSHQRSLAVFVAGMPAPQGSKRGIPIYRGKGASKTFTGKVSQVESSPKVKPWREDVRAALLVDGRPRMVLADAATVVVEFVLARPKRLARKETPPHVSTPDVDKLIRSTFDAITSAGVWRDDSCAVRVTASKRYAEVGEPTGAHIHIQPVHTGPIYEEPMRA